MGAWMVLEAYNDRILHHRYHLPGGKPTHADYHARQMAWMSACCPSWASPAVRLGRSQNMNPGTNGGIVGSVFYEVTRNEFDPQYEAVEPWSVGIPGLTMNLYATMPCTTHAQH